MVFLVVLIVAGCCKLLMIHKLHGCWKMANWPHWISFTNYFPIRVHFETYCVGSVLVSISPAWSANPSTWQLGVHFAIGFGEIVSILPLGLAKQAWQSGFRHPHWRNRCREWISPSSLAKLVLKSYLLLEIWLKILFNYKIKY